MHFTYWLHAHSLPLIEKARAAERGAGASASCRAAIGATSGCEALVQLLKPSKSVGRHLYEMARGVINKDSGLSDSQVHARSSRNIAEI